MLAHVAPVWIILIAGSRVVDGLAGAGEVMPTIIEKILQQVKRVPPLSRTASDLISLLDKPDHTLDDVVGVVSSDPMLVGQLLKVANCAAFARRSPVESIGAAVSYLGDKMVVGIALGSSAGQLYDSPLKGYESESGSLWLHSLRTAIAGREIARFSQGCVTGGVAYTAGLLHDIGKALLTMHLEGRGQEVMDIIEKDNVDFLEAERRVAGTDHCAAGKMLAEHWNLPLSLQNAIALHHTPEQATEEFRPICYTIHLADMVAMMAGMGTGVDTLRYRFTADYEKYITIARDDLDRLLLMVGIEFGKVEKALNGGA